jgi:zinc-ribbon family
MFTIIILGSKGKTTSVAHGRFYCPHCLTTQPYERKKVMNYFTIYFIPLFATHQLSEYVTCQACQSSFAPHVLEQSVKSGAQDVVATARCQLAAGHSVQSIVNGLLAYGSSPQDAVLAIYAAADGKLTVCNNCQLLYEGNLTYCSSCGPKLVAFEGRVN